VPQFTDVSVAADASAGAVHLQREHGNHPTIHPPIVYPLRAGMRRLPSGHSVKLELMEKVERPTTR
jgi:hypothetical protein